MGSGQLFGNVRLVNGGVAYPSADAVSKIRTFANLNINLLPSQWKDLTLIADIAPNATILASTTLLAKEIVGIDSKSQKVDLSQATNLTSPNISFVVATKASLTKLIQLANLLTASIKLLSGQ